MIQNICKKLESKYWREKIEEGLREKIANQEPPPDDGAEEIERALKEIDNKIDALLDLAEDGQIALEVRDRLNKRLAEKKNLQKELEKLQNKTRRLESGKHLIPQLMSYLDDSRSVIEQGSNEEKKSLIKKFVGKIEIDKEKRIADCYFYKIPPFVHEPSVCASVTGRDFDMDVNSVQKGTGNS